MAAQPEEIEREMQAKIDDLNSTIDAFEQNAYGSDSDNGELSRQRGLSIDAYQGKNIEPAPEGRVQVVDWTVFETIQWILPSLTRIFASGDDVVEFEPFGPEDEEAAEQESEYLNYLVTQKGNWFLTFLTWAQDALLTKNSYCWAFMEEKLRTEVETYQSQSEEQVALILDDDVEVVGQDHRIDEDAEPEPVLDEFGQPVIDPNTGQPAFEQPTIFDIQVKRTAAKQRLQFKVLPAERCLVDENCPDFTLDGCNYFEFWDNVTISDLRSMGYDVADDVGEDADYDTIEDESRDELLGTDLHRSGDIPDKSLRRVKARWIWVRHDLDEDGIAEMLHVVRVGQDVLEVDSVSTIPVASIVPFINTHRHMGMSVSDLTFDIQRIKTFILRQGLDNLFLSNNPREFFSKKVNLDSLLLSRPGAKIEVDTDLPDVGGHVFSAPYPFVFPQAQEGLRHMDTVTESRVGVNRIFQGIDESNINDHDRIGQLSTMAAQRVEQIARIFGNGVERLFRIAHELIIKSGHQAETIKLRGEWVEFDPKEWKTGRDMRVVAPYAAGNKDALMSRLMIIANIHEKALAAGLPIVQTDDAYALALEIAKASDVSGDKFFTDPATIPPPEPEPDYTAMALDVEQNKVQVDQNKVEADLEKAKLASDTDLSQTQMQERMEKYRADLQAEVQLLVAQLTHGGKIDLEQVKAKLRDDPVKLANQSIDQTQKDMQSLTKDLTKTLEAVRGQVKELEAMATAPVKVVRKDGKIVGKEVNGKFIPLEEANA